MTKPAAKAAGAAAKPAARAGGAAMTTLDVYTDGGCAGNPGPGGWAYALVKSNRWGGELLAQRWGAEEDTTNNRMEIQAVIEALEAILKMERAPKKLTVYTDSQYVQKGMTEWLEAWKEKGWKTSDKTPVKNQDLWTRLDELAARFTVKWEWVRGHMGNHYNELCDGLTQKAIATIDDDYDD